MKNTLISAMTMLAAGAAWGQTPQRLANGLEFRTPAGWQVRIANQGAVIAPADAVQGSELYIVGVLPSKNLDLSDPKLLPALAGQYFPAESQARQLGAPRAFRATGGAGYVHSYDFVENGMPGRLQLYAVGFQTGGAILIAAGRRDLMVNRESALTLIAASFSHDAPAPAASPVQTALPNGSGPLAKQWIERLSDRKLMQFSSYSSGSSGGYSSERTLYIASDGSYAFRTSSSVSIYVPGANGTSAGRNGQDGRWRIYEQAGTPILELRSNQGGVETIQLSTDGSKTFLNGKRWFVAPIR